MEHLAAIGDLGLRAQSAIGLVAFIFTAWLFSTARARFPFFLAATTVAAQIAIALLLLYLPPAREALASLQVVVRALQAATEAGTSFVFGHLGGAEPPFEVTDPSAMFNFAFGALPLVIFFSGLSALLWHWGILKLFVRALALLLQRVFQVGGAVALSSAANTFLGQTESPLLIRPYLSKVSRPELFIIITGGFATVAGSVMAVYATILAEVDPSVLGHIIVASIISVPAAILMAQVMMPEEKGVQPTSAAAADDFGYASSMDAFMRGVTDGLGLYLNIIASLIAFTAFAALINIMLGAAPDVAGAPLSLERILGWIFMPFMWLAGVPWSEAFQAGSLMGVKTAVNELVAYVELARLPAGTFSERSFLVVVYSLCGFANFASLGIVIGGLTALAPDRRQDVIALAPRALVAGTLSTLMTGAVIGLVWTG
ncbi:NupC/NupG family nucleoside CNT transporter [Amphiplicatus metriothermophilus]|uniref:Concentrative nucleoside transporter, CNT family n=1 Tax=Amphiplicatus metriothermophilus TaxID=1519374 RepID=A0A239PTI0_9PROT|nr:nucleoside transporter C-terminal domain-containing protein [Amphiplicatus metriothermophilus]MBB5519162.1 CNT family concentrative nucleoside transporter [Amphiplicatus metriothermophilus]SNT73232.1 concentrative nucleoside transporter, CNT family [Amphiplicatus metriothermophilus]